MDSAVQDMWTLLCMLVGLCCVVSLFQAALDGGNRATPT